jgi:mRNA interferase MazF
MSVPKRGDLVFTNFSPQAGHEQAGFRPGIILSPEEFNRGTGFAVICPITGQQKGYPFEVVLPAGLPVYGVILADQFKSLDWRARGFQIVGQAPDEVVSDCLDLIHTILF